MEGLGDLDSDAIATLVQRQFDTLPAKRKPQVRGGGIKEWVPLSGIVAEGISPVFGTLPDIADPHM